MAKLGGAPADGDVDLRYLTYAIMHRWSPSCIDGQINYLTDNRRIGYPEWKANPNVFLDRATALVR